ncbi:hypothetical protein N802_02775 [Knoellia sinensis KCTC 19936]|uniref:Uncharacterized protein n=1 Tax=Knoellia sinensis KCTC 19936 TaxID=1385520 RepID=A0A0A0JHF7_9MICO|nr:hypothetical protein N802_02775 [Knoellia sinensis KCTC 19936]
MSRATIENLPQRAAAIWPLLWHRVDVSKVTSLVTTLLPDRARKERFP